MARANGQQSTGVGIGHRRPDVSVNSASVNPRKGRVVDGAVEKPRASGRSVGVGKEVNVDRGVKTDSVVSNGNVVVDVASEAKKQVDAKKEVARVRAGMKKGVQRVPVRVSGLETHDVVEPSKKVPLRVVPRGVVGAQTFDRREGVSGESEGVDGEGDESGVVRKG